MNEKREGRGTDGGITGAYFKVREDDDDSGDEEIRRLSKPNRLSYEGRTVDALALGADEGRY